MEVIAVLSRKGGVGKTATAQALGAGLRRRGKSVLYIDLDSQTNLSYGVGANPAQFNSMDVLTGKVKARDAIQHTEQGDIITGSEDLAGADVVITQNGKEYRLKEVLSGLNYDFVVIDTPAALGTLTVNALTAANGVIIPVQADIFSLQGIGLLQQAVERVKARCNPGLKIDGILITRYNARAVISRDMQENLADIANHLSTCVYTYPIRECISIKEAQAMQQDIFSYAPKSNAAKDYEAFVKEFMKGRR